MDDAPSDADMDAWWRIVDNCRRVVGLLKPRWWAIEDVIQVERHLPLPLWHGSEIPRRRIDASLFGPQRRIRTFLGRFPEPVPDPLRHARTLGDCLLPRGPHLTVPGVDSLRVVTLGGGPSQVHNDAIRLLDPDQPGPTVLSEPHSGSRRRRAFMVPSATHPRCIDWRELALLQGFPTEFLFPVSMTRATKLVAQAIPIDVGRAIFRGILREETNPSPESRTPDGHGATRRGKTLV